jgi:hypothetical protein
LDDYNQCFVFVLFLSNCRAAYCIPCALVFILFLSNLIVQLEPTDW